MTDKERLVVAIVEGLQDWKIGTIAHPDLVDKIADAILAAGFGDVAKWREMVRDMCDEEDNVRKEARRVLSEFQTNGDSYGVPMVSDVVKLALDKQDKRIAELEQQLTQYKNTNPKDGGR
jgi:translation elongation factor EF-Tu-like GTPase